MRRRWLVMLGAGVVLVVVVALVASGPWLRLGPAPVVAPVATPARLSAADRAYYDTVALPLRAAAAEARALTEQGEARSRNLFAIRAGQGRLQAQLTAIEAAIAATPAPGQFAAGIGRYPAAAATVRRAMSAAETAFLRFDWAAVGAATEQMGAGTAALEAVLATLDRAAGVATPSASPIGEDPAGASPAPGR